MNISELKIEITDRCTQNCIHCSTNAKNNGSFLEISFINEAIREAFKLGCKRVQLSGGEPFLDPYWWRFLQQIKSFGMECSIYTSGNCEFPLSDLKYNRPNKLIFSLYSGESKIHDKITRTRNSFRYTIENIKNSINIGIPVELHCVVMKYNIDHLDSLMRLTDELGIPKVSFLRLVPHGRTNTQSGFIPDYFDYMKFKSMILNFENRFNTEIRLGAPFNVLNLGYTPCSAGDKMVINSKGIAFPCDALKGVENPANSDISRYSLQHIMENNEWFRIIRLKPTAPECDHCDNSRMCAGGCFAQRFYNHDILLRDPDCLKNEHIRRKKS